jgi:hypothetical protein
VGRNHVATLGFTVNETRSYRAVVSFWQGLKQVELKEANVGI